MRIRILSLVLIAILVLAVPVSADDSIGKGIFKSQGWMRFTESFSSDVTNYASFGDSPDVYLEADPSLDEQIIGVVMNPPEGEGTWDFSVITYDGTTYSGELIRERKSWLWVVPYFETSVSFGGLVINHTEEIPFMTAFAVDPVWNPDNQTWGLGIFDGDSIIVSYILPGPITGNPIVGFTLSGPGVVSGSFTTADYSTVQGEIDSINNQKDSIIAKAFTLGPAIMDAGMMLWDFLYYFVLSDLPFFLLMVEGTAFAYALYTSNDIFKAIGKWMNVNARIYEVLMSFLYYIMEIGRSILSLIPGLG